MYLLSAGMGIGLTGLQAAQAGLNVTGHNITNINTPGYARQRTNLSTGYSMQLDKLQFGLGVNVTQIQQIRDRFLDMQMAQTITKQFGSYTRYEGLENVSTLFMENGEYGLNLEMQRFFQGFQELAARPENDAVRTNVITRGQNFISGLQIRYKMIQEQQSNANKSIASMVNEINTITAQIARLNHQIATEIPERSDNNSRDQRQGLVDKLAELVGIQVYEDTQGRLYITVENGLPIVSGSTQLEMRAAVADGNGNHKIEINMGGEGRPNWLEVTSSIKNGRMGGLIDLRDNLLPGYMEELDQLAAAMVIQVNQIHRSGYGFDGTTTGLNFFDLAGTAAFDPANPDTWKGIAARLKVNDELVDDPRKIATASDIDPETGLPTGVGAAGDNRIALELANLQDTSVVTASWVWDGVNNVFIPDPAVNSKGTFSMHIATTANKVGSEAQKYRSTANTDEDIRMALEIQRDRLSAVDMDEEATNLIIFQRSYQACSRFINVINQLTDQLVNQLGR